MALTIKGVHRFTKGGVRYNYHRKTGQRIVDANGLPLIYGTHEFKAEVLRLNAAQARPTDDSEPSDRVPANPTLRQLITAYKKSPEFTELAPRTRSDYQKLIDYLKPLADMRIKTLTPPGVLKIRDKAFRKHKRKFANYVVTLLSRLFSWGKPRGWRDDNPAYKMEKIKRPKNARKVNRAWQDREIAVVLAEAPADALLVPVMLSLCTGLREGDVIKMPKTKYDGQLVATRAAKNGREIWIPAHPELRRVLDGAPKTNATTLVTNSHGRPYKNSGGFQSRFFKFIRKLQAEGKVGSGLTFHGLRHTQGKWIIEAGGDIEDVMEILAVTRETAELYAAEASRESRNRKTMARNELHRPNFRGEKG